MLRQSASSPFTTTILFFIILIIFTTTILFFIILITTTKIGGVNNYEANIRNTFSAFIWQLISLCILKSSSHDFDVKTIKTKNIIDTELNCPGTILSQLFTKSPHFLQQNIQNHFDIPRQNDDQNFKRDCRSRSKCPGGRRRL